MPRRGHVFFSASGRELTATGKIQRGHGTVNPHGVEASGKELGRLEAWVLKLWAKVKRLCARR